ncbi:MAG: CoA pyrophosphatase [Oligoflexales bacterium]
MSADSSLNDFRSLPNFSAVQPLQPWGDQEHCAAVCVLLIPSLLGPQVVLTQRSDRVRTHKGQVCFPGGMREPFEYSPLETAVRELAEELGVRVDPLQVHGQLPPFLSKHGLCVVPVVLSGPLVVKGDDRQQRFVLQEEEVAEVLTPYWSELCVDKFRRSWLPRWCGPFRGYFLASGHRVWGLTAEILKVINFQ